MSGTARRPLLTTLSIITVALALAFPFLLALEKISESDTFWHLKTGQWIVAHGAVPRVDPFSAMTAGKAWLDWEWLFQAAMYVVYAAGGLNALVADERSGRGVREIPASNGTGRRNSGNRSRWNWRSCTPARRSE
jgi:hypothetical protein